MIPNKETHIIQFQVNIKINTKILNKKHTIYKVKHTFYIQTQI